MYEYKAKCINVVDGDTFDFIVELGFHIQTKIRVRLAGINTPEIRGTEKEDGLRIKRYVEDILLNKEVTLRTEKTGKFGRWITVVLAPHLPPRGGLNKQIRTAYPYLFDAEHKDQYGYYYNKRVK